MCGDGMAGANAEGRPDACLWDCMQPDAAGLFTFSTETDAAPRRLLLHACCAPCSTACLERLVDTYRVTVYFYNPNITDADEYRLRRDTLLAFLRAYNATLPQEKHVDYLEGPYEPEVYLRRCAGLEGEPEGGARCAVCFQMRLAATAARAATDGYPCFGTTLTVSPHKSYPVISAIGQQMERAYGVTFLDMDFKKKAGFQRSIQLSKAYGLYRQTYCGCAFSLRERETAQGER